jgi:peptidyl-prolyl cis-trans isomerase B (cyclophilin B)
MKLTSMKLSSTLRRLGVAAFICGAALLSSCGSSSKTTPTGSGFYSGPALDTLTSNPNRLVVMETKQGVIKLQLFDKLAPKHVANMIDLVKSGFYDGTYFHRTIAGFMIQGGDPNTKDADYSNDGVGRADLKMIPEEFSNLEHQRGILSAARRGGDVNSATTQFFICHARAASLDKQYTIYGQVVEGMEVVDRIVKLPNLNPGSRDPNPGKEAQIIRVTISE